MKNIKKFKQKKTRLDFKSLFTIVIFKMVKMPNFERSKKGGVEEKKSMGNPVENPNFKIFKILIP